jgi:hypothetical protein
MLTNLIQYLSLIYFLNQPVYDSGMFIDHNQKAFTVYVQQLLRVTSLSSPILTRPTASQLNLLTPNDL